MNGKAYHLNLLKKSEVVSSSPVRLRVMLPIAAMLACAAMLTWWGVLYGNIIVNNSKIDGLQAEINAKSNQHAQILAKMNEVNELETEFEQLEYYRNARHTWGETLTRLTEAIPIKLQLTKLEIPAPPVQDLNPPKGVKAPPPWGPTNNTEKVALILTGRAPKETPVIALMESLESENFTNAFRIVKDPRDPNQSPKIHHIRQEASAGRDSKRMLAFEVEYTAIERRFSK